MKVVRDENSAGATIGGGLSCLGCVVLILVAFLPGFGAALVGLVNRLAQ